MIQKIKFISLFLLLPATTVCAGSVDLGTYYPAPFGNYDRLKLAPRSDPGTPCDPGTMYVDDTVVTLQFCSASNNWAAGLWTQSGSSLYPADNSVSVGIGMTAPATVLDVAEDVAPSSGITNILALQAYDTDGVLNSMTGDGVALNFKSRSNGNVIDIGRISGFLTQGGIPAQSVLAFSTYVNNSLTETMRLANYGKLKIGTNDTTLCGNGTAEGLEECDDGNLNNWDGCSDQCLKEASQPKLAVRNDGGVLAQGTFGSGNNLTTAGAGTRLIWYPRKAAFRAGYVKDTEWDDANIGNYSFAVGHSPLASGANTVALGYQPQATASAAIAFGNSTANGDNSVAMGNGPTASGTNSIALGTSGTTAGGNGSVAIGGPNAVAQSYRSIVMGQHNVQNGGWNPTSPVLTDPLFMIGNGIDAGNRSNALTVLQNGNVGITTSAPTTKLEVTNGDIKATGGIIMETRTSNPTAVAGQIWLCTDSGTLCDGI